MKRLIGKKFSSSNVQNDMELLPFKVVIGPGDRPMISVQYQDEEKKFSEMEISSMVLRKLCDIADRGIPHSSGAPSRMQSSLFLLASITPSG